jgi:hypothetical protein
MTSPKRHHFVAEMMQRRFTDCSGLLHFFNKQTPEKGVQSTTPKNLLARTHLYSKVRADGSHDISLEERYSKLEGVVSPVLDQIGAAALRRSLPNIPESTRLVLDHFVYEQIRRVPDFHEKIMPVAGAGLAVEEAVAKFETKYRKLTPEEREKTFRPKEIEKFRQNARVGALSRHSPRVLSALNAKGLFFGICRERSSFLIGGAPVARFGKALTDPNTELWLPIHPNVVAIFAGKRGDGTIVDVPESFVRKFNAIVAKQSTIFAGRSAILISANVKRLGLH